MDFRQITMLTLAPFDCLTWDSVKNWIDPAERIAVILASIIGGAWAFLRFLRERGFESALSIGIESSTIPNETQSFIFLEVTLTNIGKVKLQARPSNGIGFAYDDGAEKLQHGCSLRLKKLGSLPRGTDARIDWFDDSRFTSSNLGEINLLSDYENPDNDNRVDFWMEPGEIYKLGVPLALSSGVYLAKVTFIGKDEDSDFWTRIVVVTVPTKPIDVRG